jgi:hypothetical protein
VGCALVALQNTAADSATAAVTVLAGMIAGGAALGSGLQSLTRLQRCHTLAKQLKQQGQARKPAHLALPAASGDSGTAELQEVRDALVGLAHLFRLQGIYSGARSHRTLSAAGREVERLRQQLEEAAVFKFASATAAESFSVTGLIESVVTSHGAALEALDVPVRVAFAHRNDQLEGRREDLQRALSVLLLATVERCQPGHHVELKTRQVAGVLALNLRAPCDPQAIRSDELPVAEAMDCIDGCGGEVWPEEESLCGFGVSLPFDRRTPLGLPHVENRASANQADRDPQPSLVTTA